MKIILLLLMFNCYAMQHSSGSDESIGIDMEGDVYDFNQVDRIALATSLCCGHYQLPELVVQNLSHKLEVIESRFDKKAFESAMRELLAEQYILRHSPDSHFYTHRHVNDAISEAVSDAIHETFNLKDSEATHFRNQRSLTQTDLAREQIKFKIGLIALASTIVVSGTTIAALLLSNDEC